MISLKQTNWTALEHSYRTTDHSPPARRPSLAPWGALLSLAALLVLLPASSMEASPAEAATRPTSPPLPLMAPAPQAEPYGWWYSKSADPFSRGSGASHAVTGGPVPAAAGQGAQPPAGHGGGAPPSVGHPGGARPPAAGHDAMTTRPVGDGGSGSLPSNADDKPTTAQNKPPVMAPAAALPGGHSFARNRSPIQSLYLAVAGAERPETAPEVYYRFTARTMERHGGVALGSSWHQATVVLDEDKWRADFIGSSFGTVEVYSRFKLGDRYVYSQHNYLHFIRSEDAEGVEMPERLEGPPADWPQFVFPVSSYNDMPFRSAQVGSTVDFQLRTSPGLAEPAAGFLLEENMPEAIELGYSAMSKKFSLTPREDSRLLESGGSYRGASKRALALIELPGSRDIMTFTMSVSRSRWSTRKLGFGLLGVAAVVGITAIIVVRRRRSFKYNDFD